MGTGRSSVSYQRSGDNACAAHGSGPGTGPPCQLCWFWGGPVLRCLRIHASPDRKSHMRSTSRTAKRLGLGSR
jgi:hypothetical protein